MKQNHKTRPLRGGLLNYPEYCKRYPDEPIRKSTYYEYISRAQSFFRTNWKDILEEEDDSSVAITFGEFEELLLHPGDGDCMGVFNHFMDNAIAQLMKTASNYSSDHWRLKRNHLRVYCNALDRRDWAARVAKIANPSNPEDRANLKGRSSRKKVVSNKDMFQVYSHFFEKTKLGSKKKVDRAHQVCAMLTLGYRLGIRPKEANKISTKNLGSKHLMVTVHAVKNTKHGEKESRMKRGIEREISGVKNDYEIHFGNEKPCRLMSIEEAVAICRIMTKSDVAAVRSQIRVASKTLWPKRKKTFCLYSLRYNFGAQLKAEFSGQSQPGDPKWGIKQISAMLGHKNSENMSRYGNVRSGKKGFIGEMKASEETLSKVKLSKQHAKFCVLRNGKVVDDPFIRIERDRKINSNLFNY